VVAFFDLAVDNGSSGMVSWKEYGGCWHRRTS
jgi:hypothetical protein